MDIDRELNLQELHVLLPLNLVFKLDIAPRTAHGSLKTDRRLDPTGLADLCLDKNTSLQRAGFQDRNSARWEFLTSLEMVDLDLFPKLC